MSTMLAQAAPYATDAERWRAVLARAPEADGHFLYSVASTGVYCRPSCAARPPRRENVAFHLDAAAARRAGFRPCKRCRPDEPPRAAREAALVAAACRTIEEAETAPDLAALAAASGLSPGHFHRLFRRVAGVTPSAYAAGQRQRRVQDGLGAASSVTAAIYDAGFNSSGRFYEAAPAMLGMTPGAWRKGGAGETIRYAVGASSLGKVLVAGTDRGICAIQLGDDAKSLAAELAKRFPRAALAEAGPDFARTVAAVVALVDDPSAGLGLPLDIRGTSFQRRVWQALRAIPPGTTKTYAEIASALGVKDGARAVAGACAANKLAVAVPCHRVVAGDGRLAGYRWGIERKRKLLDREAR